MRQGIGVWVFVLAAGLFLDGDLTAGSLEPPGPPAPTMKTVQQVEPRIPITAIPITIAAPGSYYLVSDFTATGANQIAIIITASYVTLDLNGFSLIGVPGSQEGISLASGTRHAVIKNGVIRDWAGTGISGDFATETHIEDLRIANNTFHGMVLGGGSVVRNTTATGNGSNGIQVGAGSTLIGCTASGNSATGLVVGPGSTATDCIAQSNTTGIVVQSTGSRVFHSVARLNSTGISGGDGVSVEECTADGNTDDGIRVGNRGFVRGNFARGNTNDGIQATGNANRIEENESTQNGVGIRVDGLTNLVVRNSAGLNTTEFVIVGGNRAGAISVDPTTANPWANFDL